MTRTTAQQPSTDKQHHTCSTTVDHDEPQAAGAILREVARLGPADVLAMQRTVGNQVVQRALAARRSTPPVAVGDMQVQRQIDLRNLNKDERQEYDTLVQQIKNNN